MKKLLLITILLACSISVAFADIQLTQKQYDNIRILHRELKKVDVGFIGFNGSKDKMKVYGMSEEQAIKEINKMDINALIAADATAKQEVEDTKEEQKLLKMLDRQSIKAKIKAIKNQP